ncbi:hypothetical protein GW17_00046810 [Ensete ventricosum]|nr:hypothetical protein GW17_00046810 [Ensete ventricosum]
MALYAEGSSTTMNDTINVFNLGSFPTVTRRVVSTGETESPVNPINVDVTGRRSDTVVGFGRELAIKLSSNSFARELNEEMDDGLSRLYHILAGPLRVVGKAQHISGSEVGHLGPEGRNVFRRIRAAVVMLQRQQSETRWDQLALYFGDKRRSALRAFAGFFLGLDELPSNLIEPLVDLV